MKRRRLGLLLALVVLLMLPAAVRAQSGGPYDLSWWTVDGGGGPATGDVYGLQGTHGQAEPGPLMIGGEYTLAGGFWPGGPAQPEAVIGLRASIEGGALRLDWIAVTSDVEGNSISGVTYDIYRGVDAPYFAPGTRDDNTSNNWYLNAGAIGDTSHSYYFLVRALSSRMQSTDSNRVGSFSFRLVPGSN